VLRVENGMCLLACSEGVFLPVQIQKQVGMTRAVSAVLVAQRNPQGCVLKKACAS
jgi:hypothetical protein